MQVDAARTNGRHTKKALPSNEKPLGEWNHYEITLDGGELTLEVNGEVQNTRDAGARTCRARSACSPRARRSSSGTSC